MMYQYAYYIFDKYIYIHCIVVEALANWMSFTIFYPVKIFDLAVNKSLYCYILAW